MSCVHWDEKAKWPHKTPDYISQNKLYRMTQNDHENATYVFNKFKNNLNKSELETCEFILNKSDLFNVNIDTLDLLNFAIPTSTIVSKLIYDPIYVSNGVNRDIIQEFKDKKI